MRRSLLLLVLLGVPRRDYLLRLLRNCNFCSQIKMSDCGTVTPEEVDEGFGGDCNKENAESLLTKLCIVIDCGASALTASWFYGCWGHFSRALTFWLPALVWYYVKVLNVLTNVAIAAEEVEKQIKKTCTLIEPCILVRLVTEIYSLCSSVCQYWLWSEAVLKSFLNYAVKLFFSSAMHWFLRLL